ncbi:MAG: tetratricopeptide repeat protein [Gemmatimonadales bacterium]
MAAFSVLLAGGCSKPPAPGPVTPEQLPALEAERAKHPNDPSLLTQIGVGYFEAKNYPLALDALKGALAVEPTNYTATVYLGLTQEATGDLAGARQSFTAAQRLAGTEDQRKELAGRLSLLTVEELRQSARQALAQEATLSQEPPTSNSVAVFPFSYLGADPDLKPLERGLTYLVITDLSKVKSLTLLERAQVQSLVDEMGLTQSGAVDPATGARSGRLLRAQDVVQGALQDAGANQRLKLDANVVATVSTSVVASGSSANQLPQLFDMEKAVVFQLLQKLGIALSAAEQRAISERPTADMQAFLAFSRGLEAEDRGDYQAAADAYQSASERDPNFKVAREKYGNVQQLSLGVSIVPAVMAGLGTRSGPASPVGVGPRGVVAVRPSGPGDLLRSLVGGTVPSAGLTLDQSTRSDPPDVRPTLPEATRQDLVTDPTGGLTGTIIIIINRP